MLSGLAYAASSSAAPAPPPSAAIVQPTAVGSHVGENAVSPLQPPDTQRALVRQEATQEGMADNKVLNGRIFLQNIRFRHNLQGISEQQLQAQVAPYLGKMYKLSEFRNITGELEQWLHVQHGLIKARVWIPLQEVEQGTVTLEITQGSVGSYLVSANLKDSYEGRSLIRLAAQQLPPGSPLTLPALESLAYRAIDFSGQPIQLVLMPSAEPGQFSVLLDVAPVRKISGSVSVDNTGNRYTNQWRDSSMLIVDNPFGVADSLQFSAQLLTPNQHSVLARYEVPFIGGWRFAAEAQYSDYELCCTFKALDAKGDTVSVLADAEYTLLRSRSLSAWLGTSVKHWNGRNEQLGTETSDRKLDSLSLRSRWQWSNAADHFAEVELTAGNADLTDIPADRELDRVTARISDDYYKLAGSYSLRYPLGSRSTARLYTKAQLAKKNMESSEKLSMGGLAAVRAYPYGEGLGDNAIVAQAEYNYLLRPDLQLGAFYDAGYVRRNARTWTGLTEDNQYALHGVGVSATWQPIVPFSLKLITAAKLGSNHGADANGKDSDGRDSRVRAWLIGSWRF